MTLFEKKRYIIELIREWFPKTPIYFDDYLEYDNWQAFTQFDHDKITVLYFAFSENYLISNARYDTDKEWIKDLALHEIAHGLVGATEDHGDRWLKVFYAIGGNSCWGTDWDGWYRNNG